MKVYLAGPAVFRKDVAVHGERLKQLCAAMGIEPLWPLDNAIIGEATLGDGAGDPRGQLRDDR